MAGMSAGFRWRRQLGDDGTVENQRFLSLTVRGFRGLADVDLELRPLTVLIGANGVGKSSRWTRSPSWRVPRKAT